MAAMVARTVIPISRLSGRFAILLLPFLLGSCTYIDREARIQPSLNMDWAYVPENYSRDNMVHYKCQNFKIGVWEVPLKEKTYFVGPIIPIVPVFIGIDHTKENPALSIDIRILGDQESIKLDLSSVEVVDKKAKRYRPVSYKRLYTSTKFIDYRLNFEIRRDEIEDFDLYFLKAIDNCQIPLLSFKLSDKTGYKIWVPGP